LIVMDPVSVAASIERREGRVFYILEVSLAPGWHITTAAPEGTPVPPLELTIDGGTGLQTIGDWIRPTAKPGALPGQLQYAGTVRFARELRIDETSASREITGAIVYQACDAKRCLPPATKSAKARFTP
jgi:DsbC/DsbD-like thiol-disulfide interchange protein